MIQEIKVDGSLRGPKSQVFLDALKDLDSLIGLEQTKEEVANRVNYMMYLLENGKPLNGMHHSLITGVPGLGKSLFASKVGKIYATLGVLKKSPSLRSEVDRRVLFKVLGWINSLSQEKICTEGRYVSYTKKLKNRRRLVRETVAACTLYMAEEMIGLKGPATDALEKIVAKELTPDTSQTIFPEFAENFYDVTEVPTAIPCRFFSRDDLVASYVGQTATKTKKALMSCLGGVFVLDEAYSLFNGDSCSYGTEALNTINQFMSENSDQIIVIFCGYKKMIDKLYESQPGLGRRFTFTYDLKKYSPQELAEIYKTKLQIPLQISDEKLAKIFTQNESVFAAQAGDVETLVTLSEIEAIKNLRSSPCVDESVLRTTLKALDEKRLRNDPPSVCLSIYL